MAPIRPSASLGHLLDGRFCAPENLSDGEPGYFGRVPDRGGSTGMTQDLSELTKTFTRQLWGVASFLAPPPHRMQHRTDPQQICDLTDRQQICAATAISDVSRGSGSEMDPPIHFEPAAHPLEIEERLFPNDVIARHCKASDGGTPGGFRYAMADLSKPCLHSERRISGVGKDLAELRGSVATSFSRIIKVVRDEINRDQRPDGIDSDVADEVGYEEGDEAHTSPDESENRANTPQRPEVDTLLRPLFSNLLQEVRGTSLDRESIGSTNYGDVPIRLASCEEEFDRGKNIQHALGITEEVLTFARTISMHPETWLDFPLLWDDEDDDEYEMSDAQKEHVFQVERASPRLAALRIELCPHYMSVGCFWKIYFVLLHPRLTKKDAILLSTPQVVEARALLLKRLQDKDILVTRNALLENVSFNKGNKLQEGDVIDESKSLPDELHVMEQSFKIVSLEAATRTSSKDFDQVEDLPGGGDNRSQVSSQFADFGEEIQNKNILASTVKLAALRYDEEDTDVDKWLEEETSPCIGAHVYLGNEEDVSFSDLEDDDYSLASKVMESSLSKSSCGWVQLNKNETSQKLEGFKLSKMIKPEDVVHTDPLGRQF